MLYAVLTISPASCRSAASHTRYYAMQALAKLCADGGARSSECSLKSLGIIVKGPNTTTLHFMIFILICHLIKIMNVSKWMVHKLEHIVARTEINVDLFERKVVRVYVPYYSIIQSLGTCLQPVGMLAETERSPAVSQNGNTHCIILHWGEVKRMMCQWLFLCPWQQSAHSTVAALPLHLFFQFVMISNKDVWLYWPYLNRQGVWCPCFIKLRVLIAHLF